jgi:hypothetical protein
MDSREATKTSGFTKLHRSRPKNAVKSTTMAESVVTEYGTFIIRSEAHGPHWVAWVARTPDGGPDDGVLLVGQTQAEAVARARMWAER